MQCELGIDLLWASSSHSKGNSRHTWAWAFKKNKKIKRYNRAYAKLIPCEFILEPRKMLLRKLKFLMNRTIGRSQTRPDAGDNFYKKESAFTNVQPRENRAARNTLARISRSFLRWRNRFSHSHRNIYTRPFFLADLHSLFLECLCIERERCKPTNFVLVIIYRYQLLTFTCCTHSDNIDVVLHKIRKFWKCCQKNKLIEKWQQVKPCWTTTRTEYYVLELIRGETCDRSALQNELRWKWQWKIAL